MLTKNKIILTKYRSGGRYIYKYYSSSSNKADNEVTFTDGSTLKLSTGQYARFADGACVATFGNTSVLATVVSKQTKQTSTNSFLPLVVDYRQKAAAAGRIPTNFLRKELGPTVREILTSRIIDRSVRPLFPQGFNFDTQIICNMLAMDSINLPETIAINAASAALAVSDVPWKGPVGAVRIGIIDNEILLNPTRYELEKSDLNLIVSATTGNLVVMLEGFANNIKQDSLLRAIRKGTKEAQHIIKTIQGLQKTHGKTKRVHETQVSLDSSIVESIQTLSTSKIREILSDHTHDKTSRDEAISVLRQNIMNEMRDTEADINLLQDCFNAHLKQIFREMIFETDIRCDGRNLCDLRDISCQVNLYEPLHGSALFQRGQTQVLCTVALDSPDSALKMDTLSMITSGLKKKSFFLHYEFPAYATGEMSRSGGSRREAGHGALAERALLPLVPPPQFTTRLTAEVLESNGSSSMASVCAGSMALMDAGVELAAPVAGVAIGLVTRPTEGGNLDYRILTDLLGIEDYFGDMDFKIAGSKKGVTAVQADVKLPGLPLKIIMEAVQRAHDAKANIIRIMNECISCPRKDHKKNMPVMEDIEIEAHKRYKLLGAGGIQLKKLYLETGVQARYGRHCTYFEGVKQTQTGARCAVSNYLSCPRVHGNIRPAIHGLLEQTRGQNKFCYPLAFSNSALTPEHTGTVDKHYFEFHISLHPPEITPIDDTKYSVFAPCQAAMDEARAKIDELLASDRTPQLEFGAIYTATVVEVRDFGVMVTLYPGMPPALVHNTQLDHRKIMHPSALGLDVGTEIQLKYFGRDPATGQMRLSKKVLTPAPQAVKDMMSNIEAENVAKI